MVLKSITVLGANGFVGSNLVKHFGNCVSVTKENYDESVGLKTDVFINANGNSSKILPQKNPIKDFDLTVRNTLRSVIDFQYDLYIYISSCEVYGNLPGDTREETLINPSKITRYALSKYLAECIVKQYCKNWLIIRLNGPIGLGLKKGYLYDILNKEQLWMSPKSKLQLIGMDSVADFIFKLIEKNITNETFNVTGKGALKLQELLNMFDCKSFCPDEPIINHDIATSKANSIMTLPSSLESIERFRSKL